MKQRIAKFGACSGEIRTCIVVSTPAETVVLGASAAARAIGCDSRLMGVIDCSCALGLVKCSQRRALSLQGDRLAELAILAPQYSLHRYNGFLI